MIQELAHLADRENLIGDPAFEVKPIAWVIELKKNGEMIGNFSGTHQPVPVPEGKKPAKKPKEEIKKFLIPRQFVLESGGTRTSGDYAYFLVDKSDYVLGCGLGAKAKIPPEGKLKVRHRLFIEKIRAAYSATKDPALEAVVKFLEDIHENGLPVDLPEKATAGDLFAFIVRPDIDEFVHDHSVIKDYWKKQCAGSEPSGELDWTCLVSGETMGSPSLFPMVKRVPGGQALTGLVSFNSPAFESYGWKSNANGSVSPAIAQAASVAMNRLLDPAFQRHDGKVLQPRNFRISEDTIACFWARDAEGDEVADSLAANLQVDTGGAPGKLWRSVRKGKKPEKLDATKFYAVTLSGAQGRAVVRDWYETTVGEVQESVHEYFKQLALPPNTVAPKNKPQPSHYRFNVLLESLTASGKGSDVPSKYAAELFAAAINKKLRFPSSILPVALERMRSKAGDTDWAASYRRDARTALIKAILIRNYKQDFSNPMTYSDKSQAYLHGCLFACIERMQYLALGDVNATITNRYFATASRTPLAILNRLMEDLNGHYFKKAKRRKPGGAFKVMRTVGEIMSLLPDGFKSHMTPEEQGLFMVGYHTQKHEYLPKKGSDEEPSDEEAEVSENYSN